MFFFLLKSSGIFYVRLKKGGERNDVAPNVYSPTSQNVCRKKVEQKDPHITNKAKALQLFVYYFNRGLKKTKKCCKNAKRFRDQLFISAI